MSRRPTAKKKKRTRARKVAENTAQEARQKVNDDAVVIDHDEDEEVTSVTEHAALAKPVEYRPEKDVFSTTVPAYSSWEKLCAFAPLWAQRLAMRSRILVFLAALIVSILMMIAVISGIYTLTTVLGAIVAPVLPELITSTGGVSLQEINTDQDAFLFMVVLPALFILITWAVVTGLCVYRLVRFCGKYAMSMLSCALVSKEVVSRMYHTRRAASDFRGASLKRKHFVDAVDSWSKKD